MTQVKGYGFFAVGDGAAWPVQIKQLVCELSSTDDGTGYLCSR